MLNQLEIKLIKELQNGLPLVKNPFEVLAKRLGISEKEILETIRRFNEDGIIRRFGATIRHQEVGYLANAMVVFRATKEEVEEKGLKLASFPQVSHCYQRRTSDKWEYPLFSVIHGKTKEECKATAKYLAEQVGIEDYQVIFSNKELKKTSMKYFLEDMPTK